MSDADVEDEAMSLIAIEEIPGCEKSEEKTDWGTNNWRSSEPLSYREEIPVRHQGRQCTCQAWRSVAGQHSAKVRTNVEAAKSTGRHL